MGEPPVDSSQEGAVTGEFPCHDIFLVANCGPVRTPPEQIYAWRSKCPKGCVLLNPYIVGLPCPWLHTVDNSYGAVQDGAIFYTENDNVGTYLRLELPKHTPYHNLPGKLQNFHCECIEKMIPICWISVVILLSIVLHICRNHIERQTRKRYLFPKTFANFKSDMSTIWHMPTVLPFQNLYGILWL